MKNYKDATIAKLCNMINVLADNGAILDEELAEYRDIISGYEDEYEAEIVREKESEGYIRYSNCFFLKDHEDGEIICRAYPDDRKDKMMCDISRIICFSDCDDTYEVTKILYNGREVEYTGWQPGMVISYEFTATGDEAWSGCFPQWNY